MAPRLEDHPSPWRQDLAATQGQLGGSLRGPRHRGSQDRTESTPEWTSQEPLDLQVETVGKPMPPTESGVRQDPMAKTAPQGPRARAQGQVWGGWTHSSSVSASRFSIFLIWLS